jgi:hypothetical protein
MSGRRVLLWWLVPALLILVALAWQYWQDRTVRVVLPLVNLTNEPVALEFHGRGLVDDARIIIAPVAQRTLELTVAGADEVRIGISTSRVQNDSVLLDNARVLQQVAYRFEIRPNAEFVLVAE